MPSLRGPSALLRLQSDEHLIALTRRGNHAAFEVLCSRYQGRLLAFCRHMLASREDAEDVLQEVFAAAFNAVLADEREINARPWLYRIARNRSLNHLRRVAPIGVDSMDVHFADSGLTTSDKVMRRENFRELIADVHGLPETQRTALLLREIDALSYEQIAQAMETTVPSVKSLLVRARISLAEAAESRKLSCEEVRLELGEVAEGLTKLGTPARRHVRGCERCRSFRKHLKDNNRALAAIMPVAPLFLAKKLLLAKLGSTASAGGAHVAGGAGATVGAGAGAGAAAAGGGASLAGGMMTAGASAIATKAVAGLAAAAIVTAGAVAAEHAASTRPHHRATVASRSYPATPLAAPYEAPAQPIEQRQQPISATAAVNARTGASASRHGHGRLGTKTASTKTTTSAASPLTAATSTSTAAVPTSAQPPTGTPPKTEKVSEVSSETIELPSSATAPPTPVASTAPSEAAPQPAGTTPTPTPTPSPTPTATAAPDTGGAEAPPALPAEGPEEAPAGSSPTS